MKIELAGNVFAGKREGMKFIALSWANSQISQKLGFNPYPGTLNLRLSRDSAKLRKLLVEKGKLKIKAAPGYCEGLIFKAHVAELECGVVIPQLENYKDDVLEVVSSLNLRDKLQLRDGDQISVSVYV